MPDLYRAMRHAWLAPLLLLFAHPVVAAPIAPPPPEIELSIDPPTPEPTADENSVCRNGKLSNGTDSVALQFCMRAAGSERLDLFIDIPAAGWSEVVSLLDKPELAVAYLSDLRFQDFWPLLLRFGGEDGSRLIATMLNTRHARAAAVPGGPAARDTLLSSLPGTSRAQIVEARILMKLGLSDEAIALLDRALPTPNDKGRYSDRRAFEWVAILMARATGLRVAGRFDEALATYLRIEENDEILSDYRMNGVVNRAALLAELGRGEAALAAIEPAAAQYVAASNGRKVAGSMRQFDWIRSCALHQLGRGDEGQQLVDGSFAEPRPSSRHLFVPDSDSIESRYRWCIEDVDWVGAKIMASLARPLPSDSAITILYGEGNGRFPAHKPFVDALRLRLRETDDAIHLRDPPPGWRDLLDPSNLALRARAILAAQPAS